MRTTLTTLGALAVVAALGGLCQACGGSKDHFNRRNGVGGVDSNDTGNGGSGGTGGVPSGGTGGVDTSGDGTNSPGTPGTGATGTGGVPGTGTPGSGTPGTGATGTGTGTNGTGSAAAPLRAAGDVAAGQEVFRSETFGNEGFWTDALRLPAGLARVTPLQALGLGLSVDVDALDPATLSTLTDELRADPTGERSTLLNDPSVTPRLLAASAVIGLPARGARIGVSCALCHTTTDGALLGLPGGGSIGRRRDGPATRTLDFGGLVALGDNSRAYYPALRLAAGAGESALTAGSTEAEVDAYLAREGFYPPRASDDDRRRAGRLDDFSNLVYTALLDPTTVTTPAGRAFLRRLGGEAAIADDQVRLLRAAGVTGYPFVVASPPWEPSLAGTEGFPLGVRVDEVKLGDLNAYLFSLDTLFDPTRGGRAAHPFFRARAR